MLVKLKLNSLHSRHRVWLILSPNNLYEKVELVIRCAVWAHMIQSPSAHEATHYSCITPCVTGCAHSASPLSAVIKLSDQSRTVLGGLAHLSLFAKGEDLATGLETREKSERRECAREREVDKNMNAAYEVRGVRIRIR